jgi:hypothetical protein
MSITSSNSNKVLLSWKEFSLLSGLSLRTTAKFLASCELRSIRVGRRRLNFARGRRLMTCQPAPFIARLG